MAASGEIGAGTANGLLAFCDYLMERGIAPSSAVQPWKSAARQVFTRVEGTEDFGDLDVRGLDVDEYMERFVHKTHGEYKRHSLNAYESRFRRAVESYRGYLADPMGWRPKLRGSSRRTTDASGNGRSRAQASSQVPAAPGARSSPAGVAASSVPALIDFPFPLQSGQIGHLYLPSPLDKEDADRLTQFIRALVFDRPAQLPSGESGGE
jgi:hypothetical protein